MTNEDYLKWEPMLKKIAYKYRYNKLGLEVDDLIQIGAIGLLCCFDTYTESSGTSKLSYYYTCSEREILKEFTNLRRKKRCPKEKNLSLDAPIKSVSNGEAYIHEIVEDENVNIEFRVLDKMVVEEYKKEIDKVLEGIQKEILLLSLFSDKTDKEIAESFNIEYHRLKGMLYDAKRKLRTKSKPIRLRFLELQEASFDNYWISRRWDKYIRLKDEIYNLKRTLQKENRIKRS